MLVNNPPQKRKLFELDHQNILKKMKSMDEDKKLTTPPNQIKVTDFLKSR
jgi:hypothetical protein